MPVQWRYQIWQSLEEGAGKRCSECGVGAEAPEGSERRGLWEKGFGKQRGVRS